MNGAELETTTKVAVELVGALERKGIACAVGGAIAYNFWGVPRGTKDVDLNAFVGADRYEELFDALTQAGCTFDRARARAQANDADTIVVHKSGVRVDIFVPTIPFYDEAQRTARMAPLRGTSVPILSAEAISVFKLLFFRTKDLLDLEHLVAKQGDALDRVYVRRWMVDMVGETDERVVAWDRIVRDFGTPPPIT